MHSPPCPERLSHKPPPALGSAAGAIATLTRSAGEREAPDDLAVLVRLSVVLEACLLEDAVRGARLRQRVGDNHRYALVGERLREHRPCRRASETAPAPDFGDLVPSSTTPSLGGLLKPPQPTSSRGSPAMKKRAPQAELLAFAASASPCALQRSWERRPAGHDVVAKRSCERVVVRQRGVDQMGLDADETDHGTTALPGTASQWSIRPSPACRPRTR